MKKRCLDRFTKHVVQPCPRPETDQVLVLIDSSFSDRRARMGVEI